MVWRYALRQFKVEYAGDLSRCTHLLPARISDGFGKSKVAGLAEVDFFGVLGFRITFLNP